MSFAYGQISLPLAFLRGHRSVMQTLENRVMGYSSRFRHLRRSATRIQIKTTEKRKARSRTWKTRTNIFINSSIVQDERSLSEEGEEVHMWVKEKRHTGEIFKTPRHASGRLVGCKCCKRSYRSLQKRRASPDHPNFQRCWRSFGRFFRLFKL